MMLIFINGLILGLSLIIALGPQNLFLIKQGAQGNHSTLSAVVCFVCDAVLASASIAGLHQFLATHDKIQMTMVCLGSAFLLYYAYKALTSAFNKQKTNSPSKTHPLTRTQIILLALSFSLLNPHAIIDTLIIIGSGSSQFPNHERVFLAGVITASFLWFSSLTMTTRYFSAFITRQSVWKTVELFSGALMACIGLKLVASLM